MNIDFLFGILFSCLFLILGLNTIAYFERKQNNCQETIKTDTLYYMESTGTWGKR